MSVDNWIRRLVADKTFADVGGLWGTINEKVSVAALAGAKETTMIDVAPLNNPLWNDFYARCEQNGVNCDHSISVNINSPDFLAEVGTYDIVHCSGIIYHCPDPVYSIYQLFSIASKYLIIGTTVIPDKIKNASGTLAMEPGAVLFVPAMDDRQKRIVQMYFKEVGATTMVGITTHIDHWDVTDYAPWYWLFTTKYVSSVCLMAGWHLEDAFYAWGGRAAYYVCRQNSA
jgi:hypothetical protein